MEAFDPDSLDKILGLREKGLRIFVVEALVYRGVEKD